MKRIFILLFNLFLCLDLYSQVDSSKPNFFPHHLGDVWFYYVRNGVGDDMLQITIVADSSDSIDNSYIRHKLITRNPLAQYPWYEYYKIDTAGNVFVKRLNTTQVAYDRLLYKMDVQVGESWVPDSVEGETATVYQVINSSILGDTTAIKSIRYYPIGPPYTEEYADGFGITFLGGVDVGYELTLRGAIIGGKAYGDTTHVQTDTSIHANFFPHHLGDTWVYYVRNGVGDDTLQLAIISDSTDSAGNDYVRYALATRKPNDPPTYYWYEYYKIDTAQNVFAGNDTTYSRFQYKATAQLGEKWLTGYDIAFVDEVYESLIFDVPTTVRQIGHKVGTEGYGEGYANGFGIVFRVGSYAIAGEISLIAAKIGGKKYGDTTLTMVQNNGHQPGPNVFRLFQNYPNPFNGGTIIRYIIPEEGMVKLSVYDILGREVRKLVDAHQERGQYSVSFEPANLASGIYFYRIETNGIFRTGKMNFQK